MNAINQISGISPGDLASFPLSDFGNAMRLISIAGGKVRGDGSVDTANVRLLHLHGVGWVGFNGQYWDRQSGENLARKFTHLIGPMLDGMANDLVKQWAIPSSRAAEFAQGCGSAGACSSMLKQAEPYLSVTIDEFDTDPLKINFQNGTLCFSRWGPPKLKSHDPADRITRMTACDYDPKASSPRWDGFINDALGDDEEKLKFFHRAMGYSVTGDVTEQAFFICQGLGRDGKSTALNAIRQALGTYGDVGDVKTFLDIGQQAAASASPDLAKLAGDTRFVVLSEPPRDARLNESLIKNWTGGDPIQARELREKPFTFSPVSKLWMQCNALPVAKGNDDGIWRRTFPILFERQKSEAEVDRGLPLALKGEQSGIMNWLIAGIHIWFEEGLSAPDCVINAREDYRKQSSPFMDWLTERCVFGRGVKDKVKAKSLFEDFKLWAEERGFEKTMSVTSFGRAMSERQLKPHKSDGIIYRLNIRLKTDLERSQDAQATSVAPAASRGQETFAQGSIGPDQGTVSDAHDDFDPYAF